MAAKKVRTTKTAERAALAKARRKIRKKLATQKMNKHGGASKRRVTKSHPHRRTSAIRANCK